MKKLILLMFVALIASAALCVNADEPKVKIYHPLNAQFELVSPQGTRVLIDVANESVLSSPATDKDLLLITHYHTDHVCNIINTFKGQRLDHTGTLTFGDVHVTAIPSIHLQGEGFTREKGTNYLFLIEIGGLRIAHFGDIGQDELQPWQLEQLGHVDIALTQLANSFSLMDIDNMKGFNLMEQVKPNTIIPCHIDLDTGKYASKIWKGYYTEAPCIQMGAANVTGPTKIIYMGTIARNFGKICKLPVWQDK